MFSLVEVQNKYVFNGKQISNSKQRSFPMPVIGKHEPPTYARPQE